MADLLRVWADQTVLPRLVMTLQEAISGGAKSGSGAADAEHPKRRRSRPRKASAVNKKHASKCGRCRSRKKQQCSI